MDAQTLGTVDTPWGRLTVEVGPRGVRRVSFAASAAPPLTGPVAAALHAYCAGQPLPEVPVDLSDVPAFTRRVLTACRAIPLGETRTYAQLAADLGVPQAARAVGQALARNPVPVIIPCHRVIGRGGQLTGFLGGLGWKRALLDHEAQAHSTTAR